MCSFGAEVRRLLVLLCLHCCNKFLPAGLLGDMGQLGNGDRNSSNVPVPVEALDDVPVVQISLGTSHNAALTVEGEVLTWGHGNGGRLGHGDEEDRLLPSPVAGLTGLKIAQVIGVPKPLVRGS